MLEVKPLAAVALGAARIHFHHVEEGIAKHGIAQAMHDYVEKQLRKKVEVAIPTKTLRTLREGGALLIAKHPGRKIEAATITAALVQLGRPDIYLVGINQVAKLGKNFEKHILPIWNLPDKADNPSKTIIERILKQLHETVMEAIGMRTLPENSIKQASEKSLQTLVDAAKRVAEGHIVIIMADGADVKGGKWQTGIGKLVSHMRNNDTIVFGNISRRRKGGKDALNCRLSTPHTVEEFLTENADGKEKAPRERKRIIEALEKVYVQAFLGNQATT